MAIQDAVDIVAQIFFVFLILVALSFVWKKIKSVERKQKASTVQSVAESEQELWHSVLEDGEKMTSLIETHLQLSPEFLEEVGVSSTTAFRLLLFFRQYEDIFYQQTHDMLPNDSWSHWKKRMIHTFSNPLNRAIFNEVKSNYSIPFREFIKKDIVPNLTVFPNSGTQKNAHSKKPVAKLKIENAIIDAKKLMAKGKYAKASNLLYEINLYGSAYEMEPARRLEVIKLWVICQEKLGKIQSAVVELAKILTSYLYDSDVEIWSQYLLDKWIALYKSCSPIHISEFYFSEGHSMLLGTIALLTYAIEDKKCQPPVDFNKEEWVIKLANSLAEERRKFEQTLLGDMAIGDAVFWVGGVKARGKETKYYAIVKRKNGVLEKIRISKQEASQLHGTSKL